MPSSGREHFAKPAAKTALALRFQTLTADKTVMLRTSGRAR
jgi:hypothetical protein